MKIFKNVRSSMENIPSIDVNVDTVYIRSSITRIEEMEFSGWEYDEIQYKKDKYIELISEENEQLKTEDMNNKEAIADLYMALIMSGGDII